MSYQPLLALFAGAAIALQAGLNASLGRQLGNPLFATVVAFGAGLGFTLLATLAVTGRLPGAVVVRAVPVYLWFTGGLFSAFAIVSVYWLIPRIGIGATMSFTLTGQLLLALVAGHYGWFQLPVAALSPTKIAGAATLLAGVVLVNRG